MQSDDMVWPPYDKIQKGPVIICAKAGGENVAGWPKVKALPKDWLFGHPAGAMLMIDISVDMSAAKEPVIITEFVLFDEKLRAIGSFAPAGAIRLEPECEARISRAIVVPKIPPAPVPAPAS